MRSINLMLALALGFLACCKPHLALAFTLLPSAGTENARWRQSPVRYFVNTASSPFSHDQTLEIVQDALNLWNSVPQSSLRLELGGATSVSAEALVRNTSNETAIVFDPHFTATIPGTSGSVLAVATALREGEVYVRGLVVVNAGSPGVTRARPEDLQVILSHETGHTFGLGHTNDDAALMYPTAKPVSKLGRDDVLGLTYLYPRKELEQDGAFGCGTFEARQKGPPSDSWPGVVPIGVSLLLVAAYRRIFNRVVKGARV
ncbi:MAG: matrixin family metalloprotease [Bdellovibrionota bacterium]